MIRAFTSAWIAAPKTLPEDVTICAIGDVHGCLAELHGLVDYLWGNVISSMRKNTIVLIGDYIDRGPDSLATLAYIRDLSLPGVETVITHPLARVEFR